MACSHFVSALVDLLMLYSRRDAENLNVALVLTPNTFACSAHQRDLFVFISRKGAKAAKNFDV
jgi:hypothetical protein